MSRSDRRAAEAAASRASEAARTMQARGQEVRQERTEPSPEPTPEKKDARPDGWRPTPRNEERRQAMEEIEKLDLERKGHTEPAPKQEQRPEPPVPTPDDMLKGEKHSQVEPPKEEPTPAPEVATEPVAAPIKTVRVKVDGEEFDAPAADVEAAGGIHAYQRDKASEKRLKDSAADRAETKRMMAQMAELLQAQAKPKVPEVTDDQFIASKMDEIRFGTPEQASAALREVMQRTNKQMDPNAIIEAATQKISWERAVETFRSEFSDIIGNPVLTATANALDQQKRSQGKVVDWINHYRTIGNEVRSAFGRSSQPATQTATTAGTPSQPSDREARKASITVLPTAAARAELPKEEKAETREEILNTMRKQRGIPTG